MSALAGTPGVYVNDVTDGLTPNQRGWFRGWIELTANATATPRYMHAVNLAAAAGSVTITLPATFPAGEDPAYFGFTNDSAVANGSKVVIVQTSAAVEVVRLSAAGETAWLARNPLNGNWRQIAYANPSEYQWSWANATERLATLTSTAQIGKKGYQADIQREYDLLALTGGAPNRWGELDDPSISVVRLLLGAPSVASVTSLALSFTTSAGSVVGVAATSTTRATALQRSLLNTAAPAGSVGTHRGNGNVAPNTNQGFRQTFQITLDAVSASLRWYVGLILNVPAPPTSNLNPNTFASCFGIGRGGTEANTQLYHGSAGVIAAPTDLGANYPAAVAGTGLEFQINTNDGTSIAYQLRNLVSAQEVSGIIAADLPLTTAQLFQLFYLSNNLDASIVSMGIGSMVVGQRSR